MTTNRIAMLPKQRYKQEQRLMLLNSDTTVHNTHLAQKQPQRIKINLKSSSKSSEEGFDEEFSFSDEDEILILQNRMDRSKSKSINKVFEFFLTLN